jgi:phage terminase large subunit-like protein
MLPADVILGTTPKPGIPEGVETIYVRHVTGGRSEVQLKSFDAGVESFYGTKKNVVWLDEECESGIYSEVLMRTLSTVPGEPNGIVLATLTPLWGMTSLVKEFLEAPKDGPKFFNQCTWDEAPHLSPATREELWKSIPSFQRDARTKGLPQLGSGAIYKISDEDILVKPFEIPEHWPRAFGLDVGWNRTAAIWGAQDRETGILYLYSEHYRAHDEPHIHVEAIKQRGPWIPGVVDPAARGRSQRDGIQLLDLYRKAGLDLEPAINAVEAGIFACEQLMYGGRLKVFTSLSNWYSEFRMYRRDQEGRIVKEFDHLQDAMRYLIMSGRDRMKTTAQARAATRLRISPARQLAMDAMSGKNSPMFTVNKRKIRDAVRYARSASY